MQIVFSLVAIAVLLCCCISPLVKRKRLLCSYGLLLFIACSATYSAINYVYLGQLPESRHMNLTGFDEETKLALAISESEARELRLALRELAGVLMALPFALVLFWLLVHRELVSRTDDSGVNEQEAEGKSKSPGLLQDEGASSAALPLAEKVTCDLSNAP